MIDFLLYHCHLFVGVIPQTKLNFEFVGTERCVTKTKLRFVSISPDNVKVSRLDKPSFHGQCRNQQGEMSLVGIHALPLKVVYLCGIVVIKDHSPYSTWQLLREISRCGIRHRGVHLAFVVFHRTFQLCPTFNHILRLLT